MRLPNRLRRRGDAAGMRDPNSLARARGRRGRRAVPAVTFALALAVPAATFGIPRTVDAFDGGDAAVAGDSSVALVVPRECDDCALPERSRARRPERQSSSPARARPAPARVTDAKHGRPAAVPPAAPAVETPPPPV